MKGLTLDTRSLLVALPYELQTVKYALVGFLLALPCAAIVVALRAAWLKARLLFDPWLILLYSLPPFVTVIAATAFDFENEAVPLLAAASIIFPLTVLLSESLAEGASFARSSYAGRPILKFIKIVLPAASPGILAAIGTCLPWLLLATMLAEIATSTRGGMGIRLHNELQKGTAGPFLAVVIFTSVGLYLFLIIVSRLLRYLLSINHDSSIRQDGSDAENLRPGEALFEVLTLMMSILIFWGVLHSITPDLAQTPQRVFEVISASGNRVFDAVVLTLVTTVAALVLGGFIGLSCAILRKCYPHLGAFFAAPLLPLQIIPMIVFVPILLSWQLSLEHQLWLNPLRRPPGVFGILPSLLPSLLVASLATAYAFFEIGKSQLARLPIMKGALLSSRTSGDRKVVVNVDLPWIVRAIPEALSVAMPRALLAVLVTEVLVTSAGLGGYLADQRGRSNFAQTWGALMILLFLVVALRFLTNPSIAQNVRIWRRR